MADPKLKVVVGADTSAFDKGMKNTKQSLKDFGRVSDNALGSIGNALGVNTHKVEQMVGAFKGMGQKLAASSNEGVAAIGKMVASMGKLSAGLAGLGIGAAVASFKLLNSEAENFKKTVAGANIELGTAAYVATFQQIMHDFNAGTGKSVAEFESNLKKGWSGFWAGAKGFMVRALTGQDFVANVLTTAAANQVAGTVAPEAEKIAKRIFEIQRQQSNQLATIAQLDLDIAEARRIARDETYTIGERLAAVAKAQDLIKQKSDLVVPLEKELAQLYEQRNSLAASTVEEVDQANQQAARALQTEREFVNESTALLKLENKLTREYKDQQAALAAMQQSRADLAAFLQNTPQIAAPTGLATTTQDSGGIVVKVRPELDEEALLLTSEQLTAILEDTVTSISASLGELIGDLVTGGSAWENFKNNAMSAFAEMAINIGKIAIGAGTAAIGIKESLKLGNPYVAIAAGAALVALGAAVKAGLSNVAQGGYSSGEIATSGYSSGSSRGFYEQSEITVNVVGTLKGEGSQLIAVINNENNRRAHTV